MNGIECIDLRENKKKWKRIATSDKNGGLYLSKIFNIAIDGNTTNHHYYKLCR